MLFYCIRGGSVYKQLKLMVLVNVLLGLLFIVSDYFLWSFISWENWSYNGAVPSWSPLYITPTYQPPIEPRPYIVSPTPVPHLNIPFLLFLAMFAANLYFIIKLGKSKEAKQSTT